MDAKEAILSRRSCRKYQAKDVPKEILDDIILAAKSAPTAMNRQEIKIYVIANDITPILLLTCNKHKYRSCYSLTKKKVFWKFHDCS